MEQQTAVEQLIKMIDFEISMLEMDAGNCVEWSMSVMFGTLKKIKTEAEQAKQMEREQIEKAYNSWPKYKDRNDNGDFKLLSAEQYYTQTYGNNQNK